MYVCKDPLNCRGRVCIAVEARSRFETRVINAARYQRLVNSRVCRSRICTHRVRVLCALRISRVYARSNIELRWPGGAGWNGIGREKGRGSTTLQLGAPELRELNAPAESRNTACCTREFAVIVTRYRRRRYTCICIYIARPMEGRAWCAKLTLRVNVALKRGRGGNNL